jgi:hypothetical protein
MNSRPYLPSLQFSLIVLSVMGASGMVYAAQRITTAPSVAQISSVAPDEGSSTAAVEDSNWQAALSSIQAQQGSSSLPAAPDPSTVDALRQSVESSNVTQTVGKTLLINLEDAESQGLGDDTPTQDQLIQSSLEQIGQNASSTPAYTLGQLNIVADTPVSVTQYGNTLATVLAQYTQTDDSGTTLIDIGSMNDTGDTSVIPQLQSIASNYRSLAHTLLLMAVPQTLAPLHLQMVNDFVQMAGTYPDMEAMVSDPLRGLSGIQNYQSLSNDVLGLLTNMAQEFGKDDILFSKDDPGSAWAPFLVAEQQQQLQQEHEQQTQQSQ